MHLNQPAQSDYHMIKTKLVFIALIILTHSWFNVLIACKYNVRETGFADFGRQQYHFFGFVNHKTPNNIIINFEQACSSVFMDCNIVSEIIDINKQRDHYAIQYISQYNIHSFPSGVLVSSDSQVFVINFPTSKPISKKTFESVLGRIAYSPLRNALIEKTIKTYGVILIIEGTNQTENERVRESANQAISAIQSQMKFMPKMIKHPPEVLILQRKHFQDEKILLWSLGLDEINIHDTYAAIIYGKTRWIGPLLKGEDINKINLANILSIIGLDCECGLDMRVMQGIMLPVKWDEKTHARLVKHLSFDPENPVIKLDMNRILRKGLAGSPGTPVYPQSQGTNTNNQYDPLYVIDDQSYIIKPLYYLGVLSLLVIIIGLLFVIKRRKN